MSKMVIRPDLFSSSAGIFFILGKIVRFVFFFAFLSFAVSSSGEVAGYGQNEVICFFLVFNLVDVLVQFLFRGVYHFRWLVSSGDYDLDLLKPIPSFFRPLFGHIDILDFITLIPLLVFFVYFVAKNHLVAGWFGVISFSFLLVSSLSLGFAFHLFVCTMAILTQKVDHLVWIYRDLTAMARFPTDIYRGMVRFALTFVFPVVLLITFPAKGLMGLLTWPVVVLTLSFGFLLALVSLRFWYWGLKRYTSASS
ncbi:MAG: ABC-2 family transporter protein [Patescibacteria group bacterium]